MEIDVIETMGGRLEILAGAPVFAVGRLVGRVEYVLVHPRRGVARLVVRRISPCSHDVIVPTRAIESANEGAVCLRHDTELDQLPELRDEALIGETLLGAEQMVFCHDGRIGPLDLVRLDAATGRATDLVARAGGIYGRDLVVPFDLIEKVADDRITLGVCRTHLDRLPDDQVVEAQTSERRRTIRSRRPIAS
jgi:hypothetical protein